MRARRPEHLKEKREKQVTGKRGRAGACCTTAKRRNMSAAASTAAEWNTVDELSRAASVSSSRLTGDSTGDTARARADT